MRFSPQRRVFAEVAREDGGFLRPSLDSRKVKLAKSEYHQMQEVLNKGNIAVVTVTTRNFLHRARALMERVAELMPEARRVVLCADPVEAGQVDPMQESFDWVAASGLGISRYHQLALASNPTGLCCALKPFAVMSAWASPGVCSVLYLDNDMDLYRRPVEMLNDLELYSFVLTPHHLAPLPAGSVPGEIILKSFGIYNAGMFGVRKCPETEAFIAWWAEWMLDPAHLRYEMGYDQCWLDYVPVYCPAAKVSRHEGYNVAFWNLAERNLRLEAGTPMCGGLPLTTFHFSGFEESRPDDLGPSREFCSARPTDVTRQLGSMLADAWMRHGRDACQKWGYAYGTWPDGEPISDVQRDTTREFWNRLPLDADPFSSGFDSNYPELRDLIRHGLDPEIGKGGCPPVIKRVLDVSPLKILRHLRRSSSGR